MTVGNVMEILERVFNRKQTIILINFNTTKDDDTTNRGHNN